jgi:hypothetical protein
VHNQGRRIEYECPASSSLICLVYGDSFAVRMLPYLAETFDRTVFAHLPTLDYELVDDLAPDLVVCVMNERFMISVPNDQAARSLDDVAAEKRAANHVYPARTWTGTRVDSPSRGIGDRASRD